MSHTYTHESYTTQLTHSTTPLSPTRATPVSINTKLIHVICSNYTNSHVTNLNINQSSGYQLQPFANIVNSYSNVIHPNFVNSIVINSECMFQKFITAVVIQRDQYIFYLILLNHQAQTHQLNFHRTPPIDDYSYSDSALYSRLSDNDSGRGDSGRGDGHLSAGDSPSSADSH